MSPHRHLLTPRERYRLWVYERIPVWMKDRDFEVFVSFLCFMAGVPLLLETRYSADSVEALLPTPAVKVWALVLSLAPILVFTGVFMASRRKFPKKMLWLRLEVLGLTGLAYVGYVYAGAILSFAPFNRWPTSMLVLALALTCHSRKIGLQVRIAAWRVGVGLDEHP